jgi:hypothetical protein
VTSRLRIGLLTVWVLECAVGATAPKQDSHPPETTGTVYFYYEGFQQPPGMFGPTPSISILVDGRVVASPEMRTFFGVRLTPGRHTLASKSRRTNPKETAIELDITPGQQVFIRLEMMIAGMGIVKYTAHLRVVGQDDGRAMVAALQPLEPGQIEDRMLVTTELPGPLPEEPQQIIPDAVRASASLPDEQGIYALSDGALRRITGEITNFRTTNTWGLTATVKNSRSGIRLKAPLEFVIRCAPQVTAADYVLMHLFTRKDRREFRTLEAGQSGWQGPERMMVPFESRRIAPDVYYVTVLAVPKGEYGFLRPGGQVTDTPGSTVTFTFGVD